MGGTLTANSGGEQLDPVTDPLSMPNSEAPKLLDHKPELKAAPADWSPPVAPPAAPKPPLPQSTTPIGKLHDQDTLTDIEQSVGSPHVDQNTLDSMRGDVNKALSGTESTDPIEALNAQPLGDELHPTDSSQQPAPAEPTPPVPADDSKDDDANSPPPVPPPIPFQFGNSPPSQ